jgi:ComF family protein
MILKINADKIKTAFFPHLCCACEKNPPKDPSYPICSACETQISFIKENECQACGGINDGILEICPKCLKENKRPWQNAASLMIYDGKAMELIKNFKYNKKTHLARLFGKMLAQKYLEKKLSADCIVPIPLHWTRQILRGYNQSELIASVFSKIVKIPIVNLLKRIKITPKQAFLSRKQRKKNLSGAFRVTQKKNDISNFEAIILLDDVLTTGSTLETAANTIIEAKICKQINIMTLARG